MSQRRSQRVSATLTARLSATLASVQTTQTHSRWQWLLVIIPGGLIALGAWRARQRRRAEQRDEL